MSQSVLIFALVCFRLVSGQTLPPIIALECHKPKAMNIKCYDERGNDITQGGTVGRHEKLEVKVTQIEDACAFTIPEFVVQIIPPAAPDEEIKTLTWGPDVIISESTQIEIPPNSIKSTGKVILKVHAFNSKHKSVTIADAETCELNVDFSKPEATILGGSEASYKVNKDANIKCNAKNLNHGGQKDLLFKWKCLVIKGTASDFCTQNNMNNFKSDSVRIPSKAAKKDNVFSISVEVGIKDMPSFVTTVTQIVRFHTKLVSKLEIMCIKNCIPKSSTTLSTAQVILKADCINCGLTDNAYLFWTIKDSQGEESVDYSRLKSQKGKMFQLHSNALKDNEKYIVKVKVMGTDEEGRSAEFKLDTRLPPPAKDCVIEPTDGTAFQTGFQIKCGYLPRHTTSEIFAVKDGKNTLLAKTKHLEEEIFMLPAGASVLLNVVHDNNGYTQSINLDVQVKECLELTNEATDSDINKAVGNKLDEALDLAKDGDPALALQGVGAVVSEYSNLASKKEEVVRELDKKAMQTMSEIKLDTPEKAQQAIDILTHITERYDTSDPGISAQASKICTEASDVLLNHVKNANNPELMRRQVENKMKSLSSCSQAGLKENIESVKPQVPVLILTTAHPLMPPQNVPEEYPDYTDDEKSSDNTAQFEQSSTTMKNICFSTAKMLTYTMVPEEDPIVTEHGSMKIASAQAYCYEIADKQVDTPDVSLVGSTECMIQNILVVNILMCSTHKNPYWYIDNIPLITHVAYIKFTGSRPAMETDLLGEGKETKPFEEPFKIEFTSNEDVTVQLKIYHAPLPDESILKMNENSFYEQISINRIFVFKNRGFTVNFQNMSKDDIYDITITEFEKPSYEYFKRHHKTVTWKDTIVDVTQTQSYDSFWYLSVLPNQKMAESSELNYAFTVSTTGCYAWNETVKQWDYACRAAAGRILSKNIICYCNYGHIFTGYEIDNKVTLVENFTIDVELELKFCWVIYLTVLTTFFLYSVFLFFTSFEQVDDLLDKVFFVGDVPSFYQYAYIVAVKTGKKKYAGTTSNVTIKLRGSERDSLEHVLNYPDPELIMLQKDTETWFVLATETFLGDIKEVEIWFDSVGINTKWYCSQINIYDVQENKSWRFEVEKSFDVMRSSDKFIIKPIKTEQRQENTKQDEDKKSRRVLMAIKSFLGKMEGEVNLWNLRVPDQLLTRKERVSLCFSSTVLMYLIIMPTYSIPSFDESDTIDSYTFGFHHRLIWTPIVGSIVAFLIHLPLVYFIKRGHISSLKDKRVHRLIKVNTGVMATLCWVIAIVISILSITLLISCGFWIPLDTSLLWLVSVMLGIFFNILVLQNVSCILYSYLVKLPIMQVESFAKSIQRVIEYVELQRAWIYKRFGALSLRPYLKHLYFQLDPITIKERLKWENTKGNIKEILEDLLMITFYVILLYIVLMLDREPHAINNHNEMKVLVSGKALGKKMKIKSISGLEDFLKDVLLPSVQSIQWYDKFIQDNPGMTTDFSNKYLGITRLRQHRTKEIQCNHPQALKFLNMTCRPEFNVLWETDSFSRGWKPPTDISEITTERMADVWKYTDSSVAGTSWYYGQYGVYPGGGYIAPLGRSLKNSLINLKYLKKHKWLDRRTRAVFVEFLTYNPNVNLFNSAVLVFEINSAGYIRSKIEIQTRKFLVIDKDRVFTKNITSVCFLLAILILIIRIFYKLLKKKSTYFYDIWSIFDIFIVIMSFISIYIYYGRLGRIYSYIMEISKAKNNQFVNYFHFFEMDNILTALTAILVFVATLRLWKLLRFMAIVKITEKTLKDSWVPLLVCLTYQMMYMVAFSSVGVLFFSPLSKDFRDFSTSLTTLLLLGPGLFNDFETDFANKHPLGITFYTLYMIFSLFFVTVYVAIISAYYADAKDYYADEPGFVQKYVHDKWTYYKTLLMFRGKKLRGGQDPDDENLIIKPKSGDRYEDCVTIAKSRLDGMALVTMCVLRNMEDRKTLTEDDFKLISKTIKALFGGESSQKEIFFTCGDSHHIKFVDDRKLRQIADICERFVKECQGAPRISRKREKSFMEERIERINTLVENVKMINSVLDNIQINIQ